MWTLSTQRTVAQTWKGVSPATAAAASSDGEKTVYLWNVDKKCFLERGGRWGTEAVLGTTTNGLAFKVTEVSSYNSTNYRLETQTSAQGDASKTPYLTFMRTEGSGVSNTDHLNYFVDWASSNNNLFEVTSSGTGYTFKNNSYYLCADYTSSSATNTEDQSIAVNAFTSTSGHHAVWQLVTLKERNEYFATSVKNGNPDAGATYLASDYDFARKEQTVSAWKTATGASMVNGRYSSKNWEATPAQASQSGGFTYYVGNGIADGDKQLTDGGKMTANIHGTSGTLFQEISVPTAGSYRVKCKGFTTTAGSATFFAESGDKKATQKLFSSSISASTASYTDGWSELQNDQYVSAVTVYVSEGGTLKFGIEVKDGQNTSWTCFDDFEIEYVDDGKVFVVLDETKETVDYLDTQNLNENVKPWKVIAYVHRSFTADVWNTIVLPFDVNQGSIISAFGAGTKLSRFVGAKDKDHPHVLYFEPAKEIKKDSLYLIIPTIGEPKPSEKVTATASQDLTLTDKYYTLHGVSFSRDGYTYPTDGLVGGDDKGKETYEGDTQLQFKGIYKQAMNVVPANSYLIKAGTENVEGSTGVWYYRTIASHSRAFRGWLQPVTTEATPKVQSIVINGEEYPTETTAIEGLFVEPTRINGNIYNLNGQLVRSNASSTEGLPKGLYIVGGKKVIVK